MFMIRRIQGASMHPALPHGKIVFAWKRKAPRRGDVVIAKHHHVEIIKRVSELKDDFVYLVGDNPDESTDSRQFGWLPRHAILGVVLGVRRA